LSEEVVHQFTPYVFYAMNGRQKVIIKWSSNRSNNPSEREVNLKTFDVEGQDNVVFLSVNTCQLADDLLSAFDRFVSRMEKNQSFMNGCLRRLKRSREMKSCVTLGKAVQNTVKSQIVLAKASTQGRLNKRMQVTWYNSP